MFFSIDIRYPVVIELLLTRVLILQHCLNLTQWAKSPKKQSVGVYFLTIWHCILSAKNALLQTVFLAILPTGNLGYLSRQLDGYMSCVRWFDAITLLKPNLDYTGLVE